VWPWASLDKEDRALAEDPYLVACGAPPARPATRPDLVRPHDDQVHTLSQRRPDDFRCRLADAHRGAHVDTSFGELPSDLPQLPLRAFHESPVEGSELPGREPTTGARSFCCRPAPSLDKITRYEAHLSRQFYQAKHELEVLQKQRRGEPTPLARLDVQGAPEPSGLAPEAAAYEVKTITPLNP